MKYNYNRKYLQNNNFEDIDTINYLTQWTIPLYLSIKTKILIERHYFSSYYQVIKFICT